MYARKDTRRKCGQKVSVERDCERGDERGDDNGMERECREVREERPVKMEEEREEKLFALKENKNNLEESEM